MGLSENEDGTSFSDRPIRLQTHLELPISHWLSDQVQGLEQEIVHSRGV